MANTQVGAWYGADGENYLTGVDGLLKDGFFSKEGVLSYWPAGYPILLWPFAELTISKFYYLLSIIQSVFFAYSTYFFTNKIRTVTLRRYALWVSIIISFNPTLSLASLVVGYEAPIAACFMMIAGTVLSTFDKSIDKKFWIAVASVGGWFALATFMQPRFLLIAIITAVIWALKIAGAKNRIRVVAIIIVVIMTAPAIMIFRNAVSIDKATISTNLGVTMNIGAGPETSGSYLRSGPEVPCQPKAPATTVTDNERVICVVKWYVINPVDTLRLSANKSKLFWSPWSGPLSTEGTMARNPWLKISPTQQLSTNSESARELIYGSIGILISWGWTVGQIFLLVIGYRTLRKFGPNEKFFASIVMIPVVFSWLISIGTIGDHRFRIPTMSMSLILQLIAFVAIWNKVKSIRK